MPHDPRHDPQYGRGRGRYGRDMSRGERYQTGTDRDRYETGGERRYRPDWYRDAPQREGGYEGNRSYSRGGYAEEVGHRSDDFGASTRGGFYREDFGGPDDRSYSDFGRMGWAEDARGEQYYGTGSHYGGGFGTAPSSQASGAGTSGAPGYAGQGAWSDRYSDWMAESEGGGGTSGSYESYGRSQYGAQSGYGRDYGSTERESGVRGQFRGRGPKGYARSDERLRETICERLTDDPRIDASEIEVDVKQQSVTLRGTVEDRRTKYAVEELVEGCGAREIDNQLRVDANRGREWRWTDEES